MRDKAEVPSQIRALAVWIVFVALVVITSVILWLWR